jgi:hypothetical protein
MSRVLRVLAIGVVTAVLLPGCKEKKGPVDYFKETQTQTVTPHGRIRMQTVTEVSGGRIQYETDDGSVIQVRYEATKDGYRYSDPQRVK